MCDGTGEMVRAERRCVAITADSRCVCGECGANVERAAAQMRALSYISYIHHISARITTRPPPPRLLLVVGGSTSCITAIRAAVPLARGPGAAEPTGAMGTGAELPQITTSRLLARLASEWPKCPTLFGGTRHYAPLPSPEGSLSSRRARAMASSVGTSVLPCCVEPTSKPAACQP